MRFVIRTDQPFQGHCQSVLNKDGTVAYTDGLTPAEYAKDSGFPIKVISEAEFDVLLFDHENSMKSKPVPITQERFQEMLEVLPPCRWHTAGGYEVFHVSEHLSGSLVSWFAHKGDQFWEFTEDCRLTDSALVALFTQTGA